MENEPENEKRVQGPGPDETDALEPATEADTPTADTDPAPGEVEPGEVRDSVARERDEYLDNWKRERASFLNYKRWVEKERRNWESAASCRLVEKLLPFIDDVDRALLAADEASEVEALREGFRLIAHSFHEALSRAGIEEIASNEEAFDPRVHEAVFQMEDATRPHGTVTETTQRGFRMGERLIRAAKVVVSRAPDAGGAGAAETARNDESPGPDAEATREANEEG